MKVSPPTKEKEKKVQEKTNPKKSKKPNSSDLLKKVGELETELESKNMAFKCLEKEIDDLCSNHDIYVEKLKLAHENEVTGNLLVRFGVTCLIVFGFFMLFKFFM